MALEYEFHDDFSKLSSSAPAARGRGDIFFYTGKKCSKGHISPRYSSSGNCAQCISEKRGIELNGLKGWRPRKSENQRLAEQASKDGYTTYQSISPCKNGHLERYVSSNNCVICNNDKNKSRKEERRSKYILKTYGITKYQYQKMIESQSNVCPICSDKLSEKNSHVDHDHNTNKIRSILCSRCNQAIGLMREDVKILKNAVEYLESHN